MSRLYNLSVSLSILICFQIDNLGHLSIFRHLISFTQVKDAVKFDPSMDMMLFADVVPSTCKRLVVLLLCETSVGLKSLVELQVHLILGCDTSFR